MRYLGIDYGTKKIGVAVADTEGGRMGFPHSIVINDARAHERVIDIMKKERIDALVLGESKTLKGEENAILKEAHAFAEKISEGTKTPLFFQNEIFSTQEARRNPDGSMGNVREVDASAAALILTRYLEQTHDHS